MHELYRYINKQLKSISVSRVLIDNKSLLHLVTTYIHKANLQKADNTTYHVKNVLSS